MPTRAYAQILVYTRALKSRAVFFPTSVTDGRGMVTWLQILDH